MGYIIGAYSYDNNPNATGKWTLTLRRSTGEPWLIFSDMDNLNARPQQRKVPDTPSPTESPAARSEEHTSELQSLMRISYAVFCLKKKTKEISDTYRTDTHDSHR